MRRGSAATPVRAVFFVSFVVMLLGLRRLNRYRAGYRANITPARKRVPQNLIILPIFVFASRENRVPRIPGRAGGRAAGRGGAASANALRAARGRLLSVRATTAVPVPLVDYVDISG